METKLKKVWTIATLSLGALIVTSCQKGEVTDIDISPKDSTPPQLVEVDMEATYLTDDYIVEESYKDCYIRIEEGIQTIRLTSDDPTTILDGAYVSLDDSDSWIVMPNISRAEWDANNLEDRILINSYELKDGVNADVRNYYNGIYVRPITDGDYSPFISGNGGKSFVKGAIYSGGSLPGGDNGLGAFELKRGHMMVVAENTDGTGERETYMAFDGNLKVDALSTDLAGKVSFMRIMPITFVCKRGTGGDFSNKEDIGATWFYKWSLGTGATTEMDTAPMFWGAGTVSNVSTVIGWSLINNTLAFNEPDGEDQANMTEDRAYELYPDILTVGVRSGTPSCKENGWKSGQWNHTFMTKCINAGYHFDFLAIHWYDWGGYSSRASGTAAATAFMSHLKDCYDLWGLPIWITEFNANTNKDTAHQDEFLKSIIPQLEACEYVERYAYFQPSSGSGSFLSGTTLTSTANAYNCMPSTPSILNNTCYETW